ncbi:unnamed protein product [Knipowitschia caucasica]
MDTHEDLLPFIREMVQKRPSRHMLRIYVIGCSLAALGAMVGLLQSFFTPYQFEESSTDLTQRQTLGASKALKREAAEDSPGPEETTAELVPWGRRNSAHRLHAS